MLTKLKSRIKFKRLFTFFTAMSLLTVSILSWGGTLTDAKLAGLIGEGTDGYIGIIQTKVAQDIKEAVTKANKTRKEKYNVAAQKGNTSIGKVEVIGGQRWINKTAVGNYIQNAAGDWIKKK